MKLKSIIKKAINILNSFLRQICPSLYTKMLLIIIRSFQISILDKINSEFQLKIKFSKVDLLQEFTELAINHRENGKYEESEKIISKILYFSSKSQKGLTSEYIYDLLNVIDKSIKDKNIKDDFFQKTKNLNYNSISHKGWLNLYSLLVRNGLVKEGFLTRQKAVKKIYSDTSSSTASTQKKVEGIKASIDQGDFERANNLLNKIDDDQLSNLEIDGLKSYYFLNNGKIKKAQKIWQKNFTNQDNKFLKYIQGKTIALVGPATSKYEYGKEIDSYDIIIRVGYRGHKKKLDPAKYGRRTDVSYYHGPNALDMAKNKNYSFLDDLDFAVFRSNSHEFQNEMIKSGCGRIQKRIGYINENSGDFIHFFFHGSPNQIPLILFDLLHFEPIEVKVFYANFFLSKKQYAKNYKKTLGRKNYAKKYEKIWYRTWFRSFANHGYLSQLNFVKNLYKGGLIEVDKDCKDVLELSSDEYIDKFLEIYG